MNSKDRRLGMDRPIDRRDFLNGVSIVVGTALLSACDGNGSLLQDRTIPSNYPPGKTGMRGSHEGSFEVAHSAVQGQQWQAQQTGEHYDLIVVGAGISGLTSAYIYLRDVDQEARILILDNHDDFGGHAKRNEFTVDGKTLIGFGGTMYITEPRTYPAVSKQVIRELGINTDFDTAYRSDAIYSSLGLERGTFFDKETFGADHIANGNLTSEGALDGTPLSASAKEELKRILADEIDYLDGMTKTERREVIESHSWREYLSKYAGVGEEVLTYFQQRPHGGWAIGADALPAWMAYMEDYPGFSDMDVGYEEEEESDEDNGGFRFPDGNASVARLLVRKLIPASASGNTMEDIVVAKFDYAALDQNQNQTRIRLSSTAVSLSHKNGNLSGDVDVTYVQGENAKTVSGSKVIWSGYHALLPYVCADVPKSQVEALSSSVRAPLVYTNVAIRNWRSFANLGISSFSCPGSFFSNIRPTHPISIGGYQFAQSPDDPVILHMQHAPLSPGLSAPDQFRTGRYALLETPFETFERNIRDQLGRMLGAGGFDPARDIAGITVNRWPHGYAYSVDAASDDVAWYPDTHWPHENKPWVEARERIGNIAIAGTDAASNAMTESAIEEAHRAVHSFLA